MKILQQNFLGNAIATFTFVQMYAVCSPQITFAQITPDATLPNPSVVFDANPLFTITGGTTANTNLFHSFSQFSLTTGTEAFFDNSLSIQNILVRVTGDTISSIDGLIRANGTANLFLINPSGIIFGQNASLNIGGSFLTTTANSVRFQDGSEFRANANAQTTSPLLLVSTPVGLQFNGLTNGTINAQGIGNDLDFNPPIFVDIFRPNNPSLNVPNGRTLALVGGDVQLQGANLTADGGRIELGSVAGNGFVAIAQTASGWLLNYDNAPNLGNIRLEQASLADTSGLNGGGSIQVQGNQVTLNDGSVLLSSPLGNGNGGDIFVRATEFLKATGESTIPFPSGIFTDVGLNALGNGGNITIATKKLELTGGAQISASTLGSGNAGDVKVNASEILFSGRSRSDFYPSGLFSQVLDTNVQGNGGNISVTTDSLQVSEGGQLATLTFGIGNAGNIDIAAKSISMTATPSSPTTIATSVEQGATGNGGLLTIAADSLSILNGAQISVGTAGSGNAGSLVVNAKLIDIAGQVERGRSGLFANAIVDTGNGGDIIINSDRLTVRDGGIVSASNLPSASSSAPFGTGLVGNITINSPSILLNNRGKINIDSVGGARGNLNLNSTLIVLRNASGISTNALGNATGGNITINTDFIVAVPLENSDITANSLNSFGGSVIITAKGVIGFQTGNRLTPFSDITATSALGTQFNGIVDIRTLDDDFNRGLVKLPDNLNDASKLVTQRCLADSQDSAFIITGRGGIPFSPTAVISGNKLQENLGTPSNQLANQPSQLMSNSPNQSPEQQANPDRIVEAQGWTINSYGEVALVAEVPKAIPAPTWARQLQCR